MESLLELHSQLRSLGYELVAYSALDEEELYEIFKEVVESGTQFPYENSSKEEFYKQFLHQNNHVYICKSLTHVIGGFFIRSNYVGRSSHIANAAYMIKNSYRGQGIGTLLVKASLHIANEQGFQGMQYNMVLSQNKAAIKLYTKLGFKIVGTIPKAVRNPDGTYQDGFVMYRELNDI